MYSKLYNKFLMYNSYHSPQKRTIPYSNSTGFIRQSSPNRFRNTIVCSQFSQIIPIRRLRNSFSSINLSNFNQLKWKQLTQSPKSNCNKSYNNLKNTLTELENKIQSVRSTITERNMFKKQKSINVDDGYILDKNRQTVSTISTNLYMPTKNITKISQFITSEPKPVNFHKILSNPYDSKKYTRYYISQAIRAANEKNSLAVQHINASIKMIQSCEQYKTQKTWRQHQKLFQMRRKQKDYNKKTLVLDLDETLIHCYENLDIPTDITIKTNIQGTEVELGVNIRPYAMTFLKRMAKKFEIVIFTASHQTYANAILDELDPQNQIFSHRLYRQHCIVLPNELHIKDLRYLDRDMKNVVLVDNAAYSYSFQIQNGIPILPYYEGKDFQLSALEQYLQKVCNAEDVRQLNREYFKLTQYTKYKNAEQLIQNLYC